MTTRVTDGTRTATVYPIDTKSLGDRSYLVSDGSTAIVIDPQRDIDRILDLAASLGVSISHVLETHMHNDYVSGGLPLVRATKATYVTSAADMVAYERLPVRDGDTFTAGSLTVRAVATPGHTPSHMSYVVSDGEQTVGVFTGGGLLYGAVGRTDLISPDMTEELAHAQYQSSQRLARELAPETPLYPTHGFGSFCSASKAVIAESSTIGAETRQNPVFLAPDEEAFVKSLIAGLTPYPRYYAHMGNLNLSGSNAVDLEEPAPVDAEQLVERLHRGEWVVDLRTRHAYASGHLPGTIGIEVASKDFCSYFGWIYPWGTRFTLVGDTKEEVAAAQRELLRIGIDRPAGAATGGVELLAQAGPLAAFPVTDFAGLAAKLASSPAGEIEVLDVRHRHEYEASHVAGAVNIPFPELPARADELAGDKPIWIYCQSGMRASIAASLIEATGRQVVLVDGGFADAANAGNQLT
jgi:hydroxyacylglutathione hydrolase